MLPVVFAILPLAGLSPTDRLASAISLKLQETAERIDGLRLVHPKQIYAVAEGKTTFSDLKSGQEVAKRLGVTHFVFGKMTAKGVELSFVDKGKVTATKLLATEGAQAMLDKTPGVLNALASATIDEAPEVSEPAAAYQEYAECYSLLSRQPVSLRVPVLLDADNRAAALKHCAQAINLAPTMKQAHAAHALARALAGEKEEAEAALAAAKDERLIPYYVVAKFWVLSRFYDAEQAALYLKESVAKYPGFLLARGYLGEALNALKRHDDALAVFEEYAKEVPTQAWVLAQVGYTLAKKKQFIDAIDWTKRGLDVASSDAETRLELASRFIDAGRVGEAQTMLDQMARSQTASGEVLLRLGYTHLVQGHLDDAQKWCSLAVDRASKAREWRTRGRARYDLAKIAARRGDKPKALEELEKAWGEGYKDVNKLNGDGDFEALRKEPRFVALVTKPRITKIEIPTFASPYAHDPLSGDHAPQPDGSGKPLQKRQLGISF